MIAVREVESILGLQRNLTELTTFPGVNNPKIILATDFEGPLVLGDPLTEVMKGKVKAGDLFWDGYLCFTTLKDTGKYDLGREGDDTIFTLPWMLAKGINHQDLLKAAGQSKITPGAPQLIEFVNENGIGVGITSAPESMYQEVAQNIGLRRLIGSSFPIDEARELLEQTGRIDYELGIVGNFIKDYLRLVRSKDPNSLLIHNRIAQYLEEDLGASFNRAEREARNGNGHKTILGQLMEADAIVSDEDKLTISKMVFANNATSETITVTMGDGKNDRQMLAANARRGLQHHSIAINGPEAVLDAQIGVVTPNAAVLIPLFEFMLREPDAPIQRVIREAENFLRNSRFAEQVTIHEGGSKISTALVARHRAMKKQLRDQDRY